MDLAKRMNFIERTGQRRAILAGKSRERRDKWVDEKIEILSEHIGAGE